MSLPLLAALVVQFYSYSSIQTPEISVALQSRYSFPTLASCLSIYFVLCQTNDSSVERASTMIVMPRMGHDRASLPRIQSSNGWSSDKERATCPRCIIPNILLMTHRVLLTIHCLPPASQKVAHHTLAGHRHSDFARPVLQPAFLCRHTG